MFERFTQTARRVVIEAYEEARRRQHHSVNAEHLLWAMLRQHHGIAVAVLDRLGLQRGSMTEDFDSLLASVGAAASPNTEVPFGPEAKHALARSIEQARDLKSNWVGTEHLLLGLLEDRQSRAARILDAHGVGFDSALAAVRDLLGKPANQ